MEALTEQLLVQVDQFHTRYHKITGEFLRFREIMAVVETYLRSTLLIASKMSETFEDLAAIGASRQEILEVITSPLSENYDPVVYKAIDAARIE